MQAKRRAAVVNKRSLEQPALELALVFSLAILLVWKALLPAWHSLNTDFPNYYIVARLLREGYSLDRIYDWIWLQRIRDHWGMGGDGLIGFAGLTPFSAWPVLPLTFFSALTAKRIWILLNLIFLAASVEVLHRSATLGRRRIWLITLLAFTPLRTSLLFGQMHILVLLLLVLAYRFLQRDRPVACGTCIALAGALKMYPLLFLLYFVWKKQYRFALAAGCATLVIAAAGLISFGPHLLHLYATQVLPSTLQAEAVDPYNLHAASAASFFHRLFLYEPGLNPHPALYSPNAYAIAYPLWQLAVFLPLFALLRPASRPAREKLEWAAFLLALLVASPFPASYHFVVMIPCMVLFLDVTLPQRNHLLAAIATLLFVLVSVASLTVSPRLVPAWFIALSMSRLWIGLALLAIFLVCLARHRPVAPSTPRRTALLLATSAVVLIVSIAAWHRHLDGIREEMARRLLPPPASLLASGPVALPNSGYVYIGMTPAGYRIFNQDNRPIFTEPGPTPARDQLSFALTPAGELVVELAGNTGSSVALIPLTALDSATPTPRILIQNAESPAISSDGHTIAFIREHRGFGSIWIATFDGETVTTTMQAISETYQARSVAFLPSGELIFSASTPASHGRLALYGAAPDSIPHQISPSNEDVTAFAVSPFAPATSPPIAITSLRQNRYQLGYLDLASGNEVLLTAHDCNAYTPTWSAPDTILYATDCGRGYGLTALNRLTLAPVSVP